MSGLKKCPFCGGHAFIVSTGNHFPEKYYQVICQNCFATQGQLYDTEAIAIEAWNRRAGDGRPD